MFERVFWLVIKSLQMNPEEIESIHSVLLKCGITYRDPIKTGSSAVYLPTGDKVAVISHYVDESDNFYIVRMPDGSIRDTTHNRLVVSHQDARKTMELMFQLRNEQHCEGLLKRHQELKEIFQDAGGSYLSKARVRVLMSEFG